MTAEIEFKDAKAEVWPIEKLKPYAKNAKIHDDEKIGILMESIRRFGYRKRGAIEVCADGTVVNGHGRLLAATRLGLKKVPVLILGDLTDAQIDQYRLADNRTAEGKYDTELLKEEIQRLSSELDFNGLFSENELKFALDDLGEINFDEITEDLSAEVDAHSERTQKQLETEREKRYRLAEVFGFAEVSSEQQRVLKRFMLQLRDDYPQVSPAEALTLMAREFVVEDDLK